jgi:hypothetical protein
MHPKLKPSERRGSTATDSTKPDLAFHAVSIRCFASACDAVKETTGKRWLSDEAPTLPLEQCDRPEDCCCRYQHFDDRRAGPRRRDEGAFTMKPVPEFTDTRTLNGLRKTDVSEEADSFGPEPDPESLVADTYYGYVEKPKED